MSGLTHSQRRSRKLQTVSSASRLVHVNSNKRIAGRLVREDHTLTPAQVRLLKEQEAKGELERVAGKSSSKIFLKTIFTHDVEKD
jgi:ribosomal protein L24